MNTAHSPNTAGARPRWLWRLVGRFKALAPGQKCAVVLCSPAIAAFGIAFILLIGVPAYCMGSIEKFITGKEPSWD